MSLCLRIAALCLIGTACLGCAPGAYNHIDTNTLHSPDGTRIWILFRDRVGDETLFHCAATSTAGTDVSKLQAKCIPVLERLHNRPARALPTTRSEPKGPAKNPEKKDEYEQIL